MNEGICHGFELVPVISKPKEEDEAYLKSLPPGYRFKPNDLELVFYYLKRKVYGEPLPPNRIREVHLYDYDPETLAAISDNKSSNGKGFEWYYFTPRDRKYRNGKRPARTAGDGFWKATGADKHVKSKDKVVGFKKTLVFYKGKPPKGVKTNWIMHEFVLKNPPARERTGDDDMRLDDWVLCRVYNKQKDGNANSRPGTSQQRTDEKQEEAEDGIAAHHTETRMQEYYGILPPQSGQFQAHEDFNKEYYGMPPPQSEQFQAHEDFTMLPQQAFQMPFYNAYNDSASVRLPNFPESYYDPKLEDGFTIFPDQQPAASNYGNFIPTAAPMSSMPTPDQFHWRMMDHDNLNIHQQAPNQQYNFEISAADQYLHNVDFGLPDFKDLM